MSYPPDIVDNDNVGVAIDPDVVILSHGDKVTKAGTAEVARGFFGVAVRGSGLLPPVIRYFTPDFKGFILEQTPSVVKIELKVKFEDGTDKAKLEIPVPWQVYAFRFNETPRNLSSMRVFFRNDVIATPEDQLYVPPLANVSPDGEIRTEGFADVLQGTYKGTDPQIYLPALIKSFWASVFNEKVLSNFQENYLPPEFLTPEIKELETTRRVVPVTKLWSGLSVEEAMGISWQPVEDDMAAHDVSSLMEHLKNGDEKQVIGDDLPSHVRLLRMFESFLEA